MSAKKKAWEDEDLDMDALDDLSGDTMDGADAWGRIFETCMKCSYQDQTCVDYLYDMSEKFLTADKPDFKCRKGLVKL